jgi:hypothetical protein
MGHSGKVGMPENLSQFGRQSNLEVAWCERQRHNNQISVVIEPGASLIHARIRASWPAPGSEDTELGVLMELEVGHGETEVYPRVQA